jgi:hypothetical protein
MAIDVQRAVRLESRGYRVWTKQIPEEITPKNRLLIGVPIESDGEVRKGGVEERDSL